MSCDIKCDNCEIRKNVARMFGLHWIGEDDCPFDCPLNESKEKQNDNDFT